MAADAESPNPAKPGRGGAEIPIHPLVTKLLDQAGEPQSLVTMVGYIGPSKKEAHVRLYTGLDFQTYYEVPREKVALAEAVDRDDDNSPSRVLIQADATVELVQTSRQTGPASYLAGAIAGTYLAGAAAAQAPAAIPIPTRLTLCHCKEPTQIPTLCYCTQQCRPITDFCTVVECGGGPDTVDCPQPDVQRGGPMAAQAQAAMLKIPLSVFCPSVGVPCPSHGQYCPTRLCPITQPPLAEAAAMAPMLNWPTMHCSYFGGCGPHVTPHCPMAQVGTPQAAAPQAAAIEPIVNPAVFYQTVFFACATHAVVCGPRQMAQVGTPQAAAPMIAPHPTVVCPTRVCSVAAPCTVHHGCPTLAVVC